MDEYRKHPWPKDLYANIDVLAKDMYKMATQRDPNFKLDVDYFKEDDHLTFKQIN
jgi:hypothetical protein